MSIVKLILTSSTTVNEVIQALDKSGVGIIAVTEADGKLIGIVTDGDVRRAILNNTLDVQHIINKNPKIVSSRTPKFEIIRLLKEKHLRHMPMVDEENKLIDIIFRENLAVPVRQNKVVIMAGGLGTRLGALTHETPKPMLPVAGRPILEHIIENLKFQGFYEFILCLNYKSDTIQSYFGSGEKLNVKISYTIEKKRLGTAGALSLIDAQSLKDPFVVLNADILTNIDFDEVIRFHETTKSEATMCVKPQAYEIPYACVEFDEQMNLKSLVEKPKVDNYINAGIYMLNASALSLVPTDEFFDMPSLFQKIVSSGKTAKVFRFEDYWIDIGRPADYSKANNDLE